MTKEKLILASGSPRRLELLQKIGIQPEVIKSWAEEIEGDFQPENLVLANAMIKGLVVSQKYPNRTVLSADTVVAIDGKILGKPKNAAHAKEILQTLSGKTHSVFTGIAVLENEKYIKKVVESKVTFKILRDPEIEAYIQTGEPFDKAGAYGIQGIGGKFVAKFEGDMENIIGLPTKTLMQILDLSRFK